MVSVDFASSLSEAEAAKSACFPCLAENADFFPPAYSERQGRFLGFGKLEVSFSRELRGYWGQIFASDSPLTGLFCFHAATNGEKGGTLITTDGFF
jgi:hypothetical protein